MSQCHSRSLRLIELCQRVVTSCDLFLQGPVDLDTGDGVDMRLPNNVYNSLKTHMTNTTRRRHRLHEKKEHSTAVGRGVGGGGGQGAVSMGIGDQRVGVNWGRGSERDSENQ